MKKIIMILTAVVLLCVSLCGCAAEEEPFRLHIIANSDSDFDQEIKLKVRDSILEMTAEDMKTFTTEKEAEKYVTEHISEIVSLADMVLKENGAEYSARAEIGVFEFPDRAYGSVTYPAGDYYALRLILGEGEGKNWWCVMFPPLCIVNTTEQETDVVEYRSAILDWIKAKFFRIDSV